MLPHLTAPPPYPVHQGHHHLYDANNRLTMESKTQSGVATTSSYTYDNNGNLLSELDISGTAVITHTYNGFNQLVSTVAGATTIAYAYNARGIRTARSVGDTTTEYLLDGGNVVGEVEGGTVTAVYLRGANLISNGTSYYLYNAHGDVVQLTDGTGAVTKSYEYDAFGNEKNPDDADANPFRYCGEYQDLCSGLIYLRNRYFDPSIGRFIIEDPVKDGLNWYVYCGNNPVNYIDPNGLSGIKTDGTYYITHPLDKELLKLKQEYVFATPERQAQIAVEAQNIRNSGTEGVDWSVRADRTLNYYMIDTDVTEKLNDIIKTSESENWWKRFSKITLVRNAARYVDFALMVKPGGKYDLKSKAEWQGKEHFIYNGEIIWYDEPGNILYGHLGKVMGFEDIILKSAGGVVQIATQTSSWSFVLSYFDDPRDQKAIQKGIDIFKNTHSWIWW